MKGLWPKDMPVEAYFLKYAFPCAFITLQRGRITQSEFDVLERAAIEGGGAVRADLERIFAPAMRRLKKLAEETGYEMWSRKLVEEYYFKNHNRIIDEGEGDYGKAPAVLRELCKIHPAEVVEIPVGGGVNWKRAGGADCGAIAGADEDCNSVGEIGGAVVVKLPDGKLRAVNTLLTGPLKQGDRVMVHYGYACEKLAG